MEIRKLNMLRGIAALIVVVSHYSNETNFLNGALGGGAGQFGVMLFFILSGFLMSYLYLKKKFEKENLQNFGIARVARVIPLFVVVVLASYGLHLLGVNGVLYKIYSVNSLFSHLLLLSGISVLWTIPTEIHFYLLFILLWWLYSWKPGYLFTLIAFVFIGLIFFNFPSPNWKVWGLVFQASIIRCLPYFLVGLIFGQIYRRWEAPAYLRKNIFILTLFLVPLLYPAIFHFLLKYNHEMWMDVGILFIVSAIFFSLIFFVPDNNIFLSNRIGDFLGKISYSLYLLHLPILYLISIPAQHRPGIFLFVFVAISLIVAFISYLVIENPARKAIRSIASNKRRVTE